MDQTTASSRNGTWNGPVVTHFLAKHLWSSTSDKTLAGSVALQKRSYSRATLIVRAYYAVSVYWVLSAINVWPTDRLFKTANPLWPAQWWFGWFSVRTSVDILFTLYLVAALVVAVIPQQRWARILYAFALLEYMSFINGFDKINHDMHGWLFVSLILILLPRGPWSRSRRASYRQYFLTVFWTAQLVLLLFYTLTGIWKIYFALDSAAHGQPSGFNLSGFSYIVASRVLVSSQRTLLGNYFSRTELLGWALFVGTMYLESQSIIIAFRPRLHRLWGLSLILFHLGTDLAMGFTFPGNVILLGLLFVCSPFAPDDFVVKETFLDLPLVHFAARRLHSLRARKPTPDAPPGRDDQPVPVVATDA